MFDILDGLHSILQMIAAGDDDKKEALENIKNWTQEEAVNYQDAVWNVMAEITRLETAIVALATHY